METFLGGLGILIVGGLVTAAMKYQQGYKNIYILISVICGCFSMGLGAYQFGVRQGGRIVYPFLEPAKLEQAKAAIVDAYPSVWWSAGSLLLFSFAAFLMFLPQLLGTPENNEK